VGRERVSGDTKQRWVKKGKGERRGITGVKTNGREGRKLGSSSSGFGIKGT